VEIFILSLKVKIALMSILILSLFILQSFWDIASYFRTDRITDWLAAAGGLAPFIYIAGMALAVIISPIPSLPLDIAAGAFFGPFLGTVYSVIGALGGSIVSFAVSRYLGRELIERFLGGHINFCTECSDYILTKIVFFSRLLPVMSFDVISYGAGLTKMSLRKFILATFFGMIPLTFVYNYFGSVLVFGKALTFLLGLIMVILFFLIPKWLEQRGFLQKITHDK
jgi:uncharacterized membrane protein YdjX (TVP38/TMEM64 family)